MSYFTTNFLRLGIGADKVAEKATVSASAKKLIRIGELAKLAGVLSSTINYYTREGLLKFDDETRGGYRLYNREEALKTVRKIQELQKERRLRLDEIKSHLK
jgi:MerR family transcriptional regulator, copper efflux regulator